jgi:caffeoyl-CoA O-methyltransferase
VTGVVVDVRASAATSCAARRRFGAVSARDHIVDPAIAAYVTAHSTAPDRVQQWLIDTTQERTGSRAGMQIGSDQGTFFEMLVRGMGVTDAIEIGTFTGYSALAIARGLAPGGRLICCDVSEEWTAIGRAAWADAGVADRIDLRIGPALATIAALGDDDQFDLAFIDADKPAYAAYVDALLPRLRPNGVILIDNTLWSGRVLADPTETDDDNTVALRALNDSLVSRTDLLVAVLPIGDGVTMLQRRA